MWNEISKIYTSEILKLLCRKQCAQRFFMSNLPSFPIFHHAVWRLETGSTSLASKESPAAGPRFFTLLLGRGMESRKNRANVRFFLNKKEGYLTFSQKISFDNQPI
jgi:hypothetical protein